MKNVYVYAYNAESQGASELADALGSPRIRHTRSKFQPARYKTVINWGSANLPGGLAGCRILNPPNLISDVANKLRFFRRVDGKARVVPWTSDPSVAKGWQAKGFTVVARTTLTGHSGHGIIIVSPKDQLPSAPLYTRYVNKSHEFRVHIIGGKVIDYQRKVRDPDREPTDWKVRSHDNGFIFQRGGVTLPSDVQNQAVAAFVATGLHFGAVDVIYSDKERQAYVLEINSAPGLENTTVTNYANAFRAYLGESKI